MGTARISSFALASAVSNKQRNCWGGSKRKQNERRCRAQGFRPKLCQAMRWKEENNRIGQLLDPELARAYATSKAGKRERSEQRRNLRPA